MVMVCFGGLCCLVVTPARLNIFREATNEGCEWYLGGGGVGGGLGGGLVGKGGGMGGGLWWWGG